MYAKIFRQIFDSSIAEDWQVRCVFQDMVVLANEDGVVDMTAKAIARTTNVPLEIVQRGISELEKTDQHSRSGLDDGARIKRLDEHRDWGWRIVNYHKYRLIANDAERRELNRQRMADYRNRREKRDQLVGSCSTTDAHTAYASVGGTLEKRVQGEKPSSNGHSEPPDEKEFKAYCSMRCMSDSQALACFAYYSARHWLDRNGHVMDWKWLVVSWLTRNRGKQEEKEQAQSRVF
jgi:hypothetical protein